MNKRREIEGASPKPLSLGRKLTNDEAAAVHWFLNHLCFEDYLASVPPHLPKDVRTDKAYEIRDALAALQQSVPTVPSVGDWMYRCER